jgi:hypothetical protein
LSEPTPPKIFYFKNPTPGEKYGFCPDCGCIQGPHKHFRGWHRHPTEPCGDRGEGEPGSRWYEPAERIGQCPLCGTDIYSNIDMSECGGCVAKRRNQNKKENPNA